MSKTYPKLIVMVETTTLGADEPEASRCIDYRDPIHRKWLSAHCYWALCNGKEVSTYPVEDAE